MASIDDRDLIVKQDVLEPFEQLASAQTVTDVNIAAEIAMKSGRARCW